MPADPVSASVSSGQNWRPWLGQLLWPKARAARRHSLAQQLTRLTFALLGVALAIGIYHTAAWFLQLCYDVEVIGPLLCRRLLDVVLLVLLSVLFLSNLVAALGTFFLAPDLDLLIPAPIAPRVLFASRFSEQLLQSSWMVLAFGLPVLLAFARVAGTGSTVWAIAAVLPALIIMCAACATLLILILVSSVPATRVRSLVVSLIFFGFLVLYVALRLLQPERMLNPEGFASMVSFLTSFSAPAAAWLPSHWGTAVVGQTFVNAVGGHQVWLKAACLLTATGASYALAGFAFRHLHARAFSRAQQGRKVARLSRLWAQLRRNPLPADSPLGTPGRHGAQTDFVRGLGSLLPRGVTREFWIKDLKLLLRDASQWSQLILLSALIFVYLYNFRYFRSIGESGLVGPFSLQVVGMALCGFVVAAVSVRFVFPLISLEGPMRWFLLAAPLRPRQVLYAKLLSTLPGLLILAQIMAVASALILGSPWPMVGVGAAVSGLTAIGVCAICMGVGALLPDYRAENAAKVAASFGGLVCMTLSVIYSFALVALTIYPAWVIHYGRVLRPLRLVLCVAGALGLTALAVGLSLFLGVRALESQRS